jgi:hypothetical protein
MTPMTATRQQASPIWEPSVVSPTLGISYDVQSFKVDPVSRQENWLDPALRQLLKLTRYGQGWDSYGSPPPNPTAVVEAIVLLALSFQFVRDLPRPQIAPASGGGIQIDWYLGDRDLEIAILPDGTTEFLLVEDDEPLEEGEITRDLPLRKAYSAELNRILRWTFTRHSGNF